MKKTIIFLTIFLMFLAGANIASAASGSVLDFDGSDYLAVADDAVLDQNNRLSLSVRVKPDAAGDAYVLYRANAYYLKLTSSCTIEGAIYYAAAFQTITSSAIACDGTAWTHIELVYDKDAGGTDELKLYINGVLSATGDHSTAIADTNTALYLGAQDSTPTLPFDGKLDDFKLYQYARIADEVNADYNDGKAAHLGQNNQRSDGLVGHWNFEEGSGQTISDRSGNGNNGTLGANDSVGKDDPVFAAGHDSNGPGGAGMSFDGVDDYVDCGAVTNLTNTPTTISAWIKLDSNTTNQYIFVQQNSANTGLNGVLLWANGADGAGRIGFTANLSLATFPYRQSVNNTLLTGTNYHVLATWDGSNTAANIHIYVNGIEVSYAVTSDGSGTAVASTGKSIIGGRTLDTLRQMNGTIDSVRIYNRALSADEIRMLYNQKKPIFHAKMDEGSGQIAYDESFNNNDGTLGSTAGSDANDPTWTTGKFGSGLDFDGTDDYVNLDTVDHNIGTGNFTFTAWVKPDVLSGYDCIVTNGIYAPGLYAELNSSGFGFYWGGDKPSGSSLSAGEWQHVAGLRVGTTIKYYINGQQTATTHTVSTSMSNSIITIGENGGHIPNELFDGIIDDVRIYQYARTADEIRTDYNAGKAAHLGENNQRSDGLVGHWNFEEGSGQTISDRSGNSNDGTLGTNDSVGKDDPVFAAGHDSNGQGGMGMSFDGVDDYINAGNASELNNMGPLTWEGWMYPRTIGEGGTARILDKAQKRLFIENDPSRGIAFGVSGTGLLYKCTGSDVFNFNEWSHVVVTWDGTSDWTKIHIYVNGSDVGGGGSSGSSPNDDSSHDLIIGNRIETDRTFDGLIDSVRIYNRALSADEIRMLYNQKKPIFHAKMDEGSGQIAYDESFNNNDGTLGSTADSDANDPTWTTGKFGSALDFDGVDDYVNVASLSAPTNKTFSLWVYPHSYPGGWNTLLEFGNDAPWLGLESTGQVLLYGDITTDDIIAQNVWSHIVYKSIGGGYQDGEIYINGSLSKIGWGSTETGSGLGIGYLAGDTPFDGLIDDVRIYNYARTAEEIRTDYNNGLAARLR